MSECDICKSDLVKRHWSSPAGMRACKHCAQNYMPLMKFIEETKQTNYELECLVKDLQGQINTLKQRLAFVGFEG